MCVLKKQEKEWKCGKKNNLWGKIQTHTLHVIMCEAFQFFFKSKFVYSNLFKICSADVIRDTAMSRLQKV